MLYLYIYIYYIVFFGSIRVAFVLCIQPPSLRSVLNFRFLQAMSLHRKYRKESVANTAVTEQVFLELFSDLAA
jgi:hypothetical protein